MSRLEHTSPVCTCDRVALELETHEATLSQVRMLLDFERAANGDLIKRATNAEVEREALQRERDTLKRPTCNCGAGFVDNRPGPGHYGSCPLVGTEKGVAELAEDLRWARANGERYRAERDTALADLAAARAELDALADKLKSASSIGSVFTMGTVRATEALMAAEQQRDAAITRAETAERALAALRRRVEEAAREDTTEVATIRAATAFPEVIKSYDAASVLHVLRALDATRAAAGELRAALERIASWDDNAPTGSDRRTFDFWKETVRELGLIARNALKEPTP